MGFYSLGMCGTDGVFGSAICICVLRYRAGISFAGICLLRSQPLRVGVASEFSGNDLLRTLVVSEASMP